MSLHLTLCLCGSYFARGVSVSPVWHSSHPTSKHSSKGAPCCAVARSASLVELGGGEMCC